MLRDDEGREFWGQNFMYKTVRLSMFFIIKKSECFTN